MIRKLMAVWECIVAEWRWQVLIGRERAAKARERAERGDFRNDSKASW